MITPNFRIFAAYSHENCCYETVSRHIKIYGQEVFQRYNIKLGEKINSQIGLTPELKFTSFFGSNLF